MHEHGIKVENYHDLTSLKDLLEVLQNEWGEVFYQDARFLNDETLGKMAAAGQPDDSGRLATGMGVSLHDINCRKPDWLNGRYGGLDLLTNIASSAVLAAVCNIIIDNHPYKHLLKRN